MNTYKKWNIVKRGGILPKTDYPRVTWRSTMSSIVPVHTNPLYIDPLVDSTNQYPDGSTQEKAIASYGIIVCIQDRSSPPGIVRYKYLLIQRRDTFEYMDFLRGIWTSYTTPEFLFSRMTTLERDRLLNYSFNDLWKDLWIHDYGIAKDGRQKAIRRFNLVYNRISDLVKYTRNVNPDGSIITEPPWGFPKGKKSGKETIMECAIRETREETRLNITKEMLLDIEPIVERFKGTDNREYITMYYIAVYPNEEIPERLAIKDCIRTSMISEEVERMLWVTKEDSVKLLDEHRRGLLYSVEDILLKHIQKS